MSIPLLFCCSFGTLIILRLQQEEKTVKRSEWASRGRKGEPCSLSRPIKAWWLLSTLLPQPPSHTYESHCPIIFFFLIRLDFNYFCSLFLSFFQTYLYNALLPLQRTTFQWQFDWNFTRKNQRGKSTWTLYRFIIYFSLMIGAYCCFNLLIHAFKKYTKHVAMSQLNNLVSPKGHFCRK